MLALCGNLGRVAAYNVHMWPHRVPCMGFSGRSCKASHDLASEGPRMSLPLYPGGQVSFLGQPRFKGRKIKAHLLTWGALCTYREGRNWCRPSSETVTHILFVDVSIYSCYGLRIWCSHLYLLSLLSFTVAKGVLVSVSLPLKTYFWFCSTSWYFLRWRY